MLLNRTEPSRFAPWRFACFGLAHSGVSMTRPPGIGPDDVLDLDLWKEVVMPKKKH